MKLIHKKVYRGIPLFLCVLLTFASASTLATEETEIDSVSDFIRHMVTTHGFEPHTLKILFTKTKVNKSILKTIQSPYEAKPWHEYRHLFVTQSRIRRGVEFWQNNNTILSETFSKYGVPAELIVAIIGVETQYGGYTGSYQVLDALFTLAFNYSKRSKFFRSELEHFLLLCREERIEPTAPKGSYAGAMGIPQFMPSSFRHYAVDNDNDNQRDIWNNYSDAIASVANYFVRHGWKRGEPIIFSSAVKGSQYKAIAENGLAPNYTGDQLRRYNIRIPNSMDSQIKARLFEFEEPKGYSYWLGLHNFYVITRYNHSAHYAMAVYQLAQAIVEQRNRS